MTGCYPGFKYKTPQDIAKLVEEEVPASRVIDVSP